MPEQITTKISLTIMEFLGIIGSVLGFFMAVIGYIIKRSVFNEIDNLKREKQDKPYCTQQLALCQKDFHSVFEDIKSIKDNINEERKEIKNLHHKMDRLLGYMKIKYEDLNNN